MDEALKVLRSMGVRSLLVEGGAVQGPAVFFERLAVIREQHDQGVRRDGRQEPAQLVVEPGDLGVVGGDEVG